MTNAGEVNQAIGQAYVHVFIAALEANIKPFENKFVVYSEPEKTTFTGRNGKNYSFDICGVCRRPWTVTEVFGECKGYSKGTSLMADFRSFLAKAYVTSTDHQRHRNDEFWFVTNVPFACSEGREVLGLSFVRGTLTESTNETVREILGNGHVDDSLIRSLIPRL